MSLVGSTESPLAKDGEGTAAFWRTSYYPDDRSQVFTIKPRFAPTFDAEAIGSFSRQYELKSDAEWLLPRQKQVYFRSEQSAEVRVDYDDSKLTEPGLYVGTVEGLADGHVGFRLVNTIIVPHRFGPENDYRLSLKGQKVEGWQVNRHFVAVPPGASAMHVSLRAPVKADWPVPFTLQHVNCCHYNGGSSWPNNPAAGAKDRAARPSEGCQTSLACVALSNRVSRQ